MPIGSLEYAVIGLEDHPFVEHILPELHAIQKKGPIRVVDLLFVTKDTDSTVTVKEVNEQSDEDLSAYDGIAEYLMGLFTAEDVARLAEEIPCSRNPRVISESGGVMMGELLLVLPAQKGRNSIC
ncbi:MAG: hypothetical protein ACYDER_22350 [Ktedonobacteraceae bacterium]